MSEAPAVGTCSGPRPKSADREGGTIKGGSYLLRWKWWIGPLQKSSVMKQKQSVAFMLRLFNMGYAQGRIARMRLSQRTGSRISRRIWHAAALMRTINAGTHFTNLERMESCANFSGKEGHTDIQPSTRAGDWTWDLRVHFGVGGRDLSANPSAIWTSCFV